MTPPSSSPCSPPIARVQRTNSCATPVNVSPWQIPRKMQSLCDLPTPPLTPDDDAGSTPCSLAGRQSNDALDLLLNIFPRNGVGLLSYAKSVCLSAPDLGVSFDGIMLESPGEPKTLYIDGKNASAVGFRERYANHLGFVLTVLLIGDLQHRGIARSCRRPTSMLCARHRSRQFVSGVR